MVNMWIEDTHPLSFSHSLSHFKNVDVENLSSSSVVVFAFINVTTKFHLTQIMDKVEVILLLQQIIYFMIDMNQYLINYLLKIVSLVCCKRYP